MGMHGGQGRGQGAGLELMTPEERAAHRTQMQSLTSLDAMQRLPGRAPRSDG